MSGEILRVNSRLRYAGRGVCMSEKALPRVLDAVVVKCYRDRYRSGNLFGCEDIASRGRWLESSESGELNGTTPVVITWPHPVLGKVFFISENTSGLPFQSRHNFGSNSRRFPRIIPILPICICAICARFWRFMTVSAFIYMKTRDCCLRLRQRSKTPWKLLTRRSKLQSWPEMSRRGSWIKVGGFKRIISCCWRWWRERVYLDE